MISIETVLERTNLTVTNFCKRYDIPERTVMNWKKGVELSATTRAFFELILKHETKKECTCCRKVKETTEFPLVKLKTGLSRRSICKECHNRKNKERQQKRRDDRKFLSEKLKKDTTEITCRVCGETKPREEFRDSGVIRYDGSRLKQTICKNCDREHQRKYREANKEKLAEYYKNYRTRGARS